MKTQTVYLGIDVSKKTLHLGSPEKFIKPFQNSLQGIDSLIKHLVKLRPTLVAMEASGGYERTACDALQDAGIPVCVLQPSCVRHFAKSIKILAKTDNIDSCVIARFAEATKPAPTPKTPENIRKFRALNDRRQQLVEDRVRENNRLETCTDPEVSGSIQANIKHIEQLIDETQLAIEKLRQSDDQLNAKSQIMMQQKGIGPQVANTLLAHLPELGTMQRQQVAAIAGLAPHANESGSWTGKRRIYGGRAQIRKALYMAARSAARWCPVISQFYNRLRENGKPFKVAIIACARKLLIRLNTLLKNQNVTPVELQLT